MFKWLIKKLTSNAARAAVETAAGATTGGVPIWIRVIFWCLNNPLVILFAVTTIVFSIMYGYERSSVSRIETLIKKKDNAIALVAAELAKMVQNVETCQKSVETYKGDYTAREQNAKKQQLVYGDLVNIIQTKCVTQQKIEETDQERKMKKSANKINSTIAFLKKYLTRPPKKICYTSSICRRYRPIR